MCDYYTNFMAEKGEKPADVKGQFDSFGIWNDVLRYLFGDLCCIYLAV